ncbi:hypothetical protein [Aphanothece sacrum]|uniref:hypothetical protein n=1 Tax=Aphanothece sacrum TaxID=1122 RepID=UPI001D131BF9|nr:hypothetical protein [Aphanothece sacrum]
MTSFNCYLALRLWQLTLTLKRVTKTLTWLESRIHHIFSGAPNIILQGQQGTSTLKQSYQKLNTQLHQVQQVIGLVNLIIKIWQRQKL